MTEATMCNQCRRLHRPGPCPPISHDVESPGELLKFEEWSKQQSLMDRLISQGADKFLDIETIPNLDSSFVGQKKCVCCMDEGTADMNGDTKLAMAGTGILYPASSWKERLDRVANLYIQHGIEVVTSHDGCGAAGIAWKKDGGLEGTGINTSDEYGKKWVNELQIEINEKLRADSSTNKSVDSQHILSDDMVRPAQFHNARVTWFDATSKFNPHVLGDQVPKGFLIDYKVSADDSEKDYPFAELQVAINIALGDHGFGKRFSTENPFTIVVISNSQVELDEIKDRIQQMISVYNGVVKVDGKIK